MPLDHDHAACGSFGSSIYDRNLLLRPLLSKRWFVCHSTSLFDLAIMVSRDDVAIGQSAFLDLKHQFERLDKVYGNVAPRVGGLEHKTKDTDKSIMAINRGRTVLEAKVSETIGRLNGLDRALRAHNRGRTVIEGKLSSMIGQVNHLTLPEGAEGPTTTPAPLPAPAPAVASHRGPGAVEPIRDARSPSMISCKSVTIASPEAKGRAQSEPPPWAFAGPIEGPLFGHMY